jgi:hypothetical protein
MLVLSLIRGSFDVLIRNAVAAALPCVLVVAVASGALARSHGDMSARACHLEVLHSEELPVGPMFYHTVKASVLITAPGEPPVVRSVEGAIPWQVPAPRQGRKMRVACDAVGAALGLE